MKPSIETAKKLADALEVSLDYLVGNGELKTLDKKTLKRLEDIERLPDEDRNHIFYPSTTLLKLLSLKLFNQKARYPSQAFSIFLIRKI